MASSLELELEPSSRSLCGGESPDQLEEGVEDMLRGIGLGGIGEGSPHRLEQFSTLLE